MLKRGTIRRKVRKTAKKGIRTRVKHKRATQADFKRSWGVPATTKLRYRGIKGILWYWTSIQVRQDDFKKYKGECVDMCGRVAEHWWDFDCGHFVPAANCGFGLLFDRANLHGQMKVCNNPRFSPHSLIGFALGLDKRYGKGTAEALFKRKQEKTKEWSRQEYEKRIKLLPVYQKSLYLK